MFGGARSEAGGVNRLAPQPRRPTPLDQQTVIRMNRDTLYSFAIVDISAGATLTVPESGDRYVSVMVVNQDHYINRIFHDAGDYDADRRGVRHPLRAGRGARLRRPRRPRRRGRGERAAGPASRSTASAATPFVPADYDQESLDATRRALLDLAIGIGGFDRHVRDAGRGRPGAPPARHRRGLGRPARERGLLRRGDARPSRRRVRAAPGGRPGRRLLVGLGLQRRRLLRAERPRRRQRQQRDRASPTPTAR